MSPLAEKFTVPAVLIAVATCCLFFTTAAVTARALTKALDSKRVQADDILILFAIFGFVAFVSIFFDAAIAGQGTFISRLSPEAVQRVRLFSNILSIVYVPTILAAKIAILVQTARFFLSIRRRAMYWISWALLAASTIGYTAILLLRVLACIPRAKLANPNVSGKCISRSMDAVIAGAVGITSNVAIFVLMIFISTKVQFTHTKKICVALILGFGAFACASSILELFKGLKMAGSSDFSSAVFSVNLWALAEMAFLLIIACSPTLPRLLDLIVRKTSEPDPETHAKWIWNPSSRSTTPGSKADILGRETPAVSRNSPIPTPTQTPAPSHPSLNTLPSISPSQVLPSYRPFSIFEPVEQRISHLSHSTWHSAASNPPSRASSQRVSTSPVSPVSPVDAEISNQELRAWEMSVVPVAMGNITKTIHVRVSAHTNPGSPVKWGAPDPLW